MADGPVIQRASERALARGIGLPRVLAMVRAFRSANNAHAARADGLREPDRALRHRALRCRRGRRRRRRRARRRLSARRMRSLRREAEGRAASIRSSCSRRPRPMRASRRSAASRAATSTTCRSRASPVPAHLDTAAVAQMVPRIKAHVKLPVGVGFGIRDAAIGASRGARGRRGGHRLALVQLLRRHSRATRWSPRRAAFIAEIRAALDPIEGEAR